MSASFRVPAASILPLAGILAAGCLSLSKAYPEKRRFALEAPPRVEAKGAPRQGVLRVDPFRVSPLHASSELVVRTGDAEYESDFYNGWFAPPGPMVTSAVEEWLRGARVFESVVPAGAGVDAAASLGGLVTALHGDQRGETARAVLGMDVYVVTEEDPQRILFHRAYRKEVDVPGKSAEALALGLNEAFRLVLAGLEQDLSTALRE
jgi:cholesterol transport system auxiliary component